MDTSIKTTLTDTSILDISNTTLMETSTIDTSIDATLVVGAEVQPAAGVVEIERPGAGKLEVGKALNYSVANLGASLFYGLFNFGMPLYLNTYHLPAILIGLLANERSFVGAFIQPMV